MMQSLLIGNVVNISCEENAQQLASLRVCNQSGLLLSQKSGLRSQKNVLIDCVSWCPILCKSEMVHIGNLQKNVHLNTSRRLQRQVNQIQTKSIDEFSLVYPVENLDEDNFELHKSRVLLQIWTENDCDSNQVNFFNYSNDNYL